MTELLLELFSEEIPARMQQPAADDLKRLAGDALRTAGLEFGEIETYVTPRRLTLVVDGLPTHTPASSEERRGPRADAPDKAVTGFLGSVGLTRDQVEERDTPKGRFLFAVIEKEGGETRAMLPEIFAGVIRAIPWRKSMRWGGNSMRWVRPLHHVLAIFDGATLDGALDLGGEKLPFTDETRGHRFHAPDSFAVTGFDDYRAKLRDAFVVLDREDRKGLILEGINRLATDNRLVVRDDPALVEEVAGLIEWPVPMIGKIDKRFMEMPAEVLVAAMRSHQKYFALEDKDGDLAARFVTVSNMAEDPARDATIIAGNEKVLRARLADAKFFWDQDCARSLEDRFNDLSGVMFYEGLGTLADKAMRVGSVANLFATHVLGTDPKAAGRAGLLAKVDLTTEMVKEFPELQGVMGRYYARHGKEPEEEEVANAIAEHYAPLGPSDACPIAPASVAVALTDKLDTLVGFFGIGEKPTGSKDPFALRRAALGVIRLIMENDLSFSLNFVIEQSWKFYENRIGQPDGLFEFILDRFKVYLRDQGIRHDLIAAALAVGGEDDLNRLKARVDALSEFLDSEDGASLLIAYRRAANILRIEEKKDGRSYTGAVDSDRLKMAEEKELHITLHLLNKTFSGMLAKQDFIGAMNLLVTLRGPVDDYFKQVTVNVDRRVLRENRLRTLAGVVAAMNKVADFSLVEG